MLGKTAGGLFWMFRYLERSENIARLIETGSRMSRTHAFEENEWESILATAAVRDEYLEKYEAFDENSVVDFMLRDKSNPFSVISVINEARMNARLVRTALTREVWEAVNDCWITVQELLARPVKSADLPNTLGIIRQKSALVRGALHGTMLRNDIFNFSRAGTFIERADNTARILDVKYYVLLPAVSFVGSSIDNAQWETILRAASADRVFRWLHGGEFTPDAIVDFLVLDRRMPRSLAFCVQKLVSNFSYLQGEYGEEKPCLDMAKNQLARLRDINVEKILANGLHEFLQGCINENNTLAGQIEQDYRFYD